MPRPDYPDHAFLPAILTPEEIKDPKSVIKSLFSTYHLPEIRTELRSMFDYLVTGLYPKGTTKEERYEMVYLFRKLEKLVEVAHLLNEEGNKKKSSDWH